MKNQTLYARTFLILNLGCTQPGVHVSSRGEQQAEYSTLLETNQRLYTCT